MQLPLTYLFVPGNRPERFAKALAAGAGAVILDLEDAVSPAEKRQARANIVQCAAAHPGLLDNILVRINDVASEWFDADLECLRQSGIRCAMLPKAESATAVAAVLPALATGGAVVPLIETARGVQDCAAIAGAPGVQRLAFGTLDYALDLELADDPQGRGLAYPSAQIAIASRAAGIATPIAGVTASLGDEERLLADLAFARAFGFGAKLCIHPQQVGPIHRAFLPGEREVDWARRVVAAAVASGGAAQVDGKMVDRPVLLRAERILERTAGSGKDFPETTSHLPNH